MNLYILQEATQNGWNISIYLIDSIAYKTYLQSLYLFKFSKSRLQLEKLDKDYRKQKGRVKEWKRNIKDREERQANKNKRDVRSVWLFHHQKNC